MLEDKIRPARILPDLSINPPQVLIGLNLSPRCFFFNVFGLRAPHHKITYCKRNITLATLQRIQVDSLFLLEMKFSIEVFILYLPVFLALY